MDESAGDTIVWLTAELRSWPRSGAECSGWKLDTPMARTVRVEDLNRSVPGVDPGPSPGDTAPRPWTKEQIEDVQAQGLHGGVETAQRIIAPMVGIC